MQVTLSMASILPNAVGFGNAQPRAYTRNPGIIMEGLV
jgi:hypothetical protein